LLITIFISSRYTKLITNTIIMITALTVLTWVSIITGGLLVLLFLMSLIGGLDLDTDVGSTDVDTDAGGIGLIKGFLTFVSVSSWVIKVVLHSSENPVKAIGFGILAGILAFFLLNYVFKLLLKTQSNVNWSMSDAMFTKGEVYLTIPSEGKGIVNVNINGANRELEAKSNEKLDLKTGTKIQIVDIEDNFVIVEKLNS